MLLRVFKSFHISMLLLTPLLGVALWLYPFLNTGVQDFPFDSLPMPLYKLFLSAVQASGSPIFELIIAFILILLQVFLVIRLNILYAILPERTYLPGIIFMLIASSLTFVLRLHPAMLSNICFLLTLDLVFGSYHKDNALSNYFDAGLLMAIGTLLYFNTAFFMLIVWIALLVIRPFNWREWAVTIIGFIVPFFLAIAYWFVNGVDIYPILITGFLYFIPDEFNIINYLQLSHICLMGFFVLLLLIALVFFNRLKNVKIRTRKYYTIFNSILLVCIIIFLVLPLASVELLVFFAIPYSYFLANYFIASKSRLRNEIFFFVLIAAILIVQYIRI